MAEISMPDFPRRWVASDFITELDSGKNCTVIK
jgi:hypothetical protein